MSLAIKDESYECPITLEPLTSKDAVVASCGHNFSSQGILEHIQSKGIKCDISELFKEKVEEQLQHTEVKCPSCAKRIRSISDNHLLRQLIERTEKQQTEILSLKRKTEVAEREESKRARVEPSPTITIYVKTLTGKTEQCTIARNETIAKLFVEYAKLSGESVHQFKLIVNNRQIQPWEKLNKYVSGDRKELTVHTVERLGGGRYPEFITEASRSSCKAGASEEEVYAKARNLYDSAIEAAIKKVK